MGSVSGWGAARSTFRSHRPAGVNQGDSPTAPATSEAPIPWVASSSRSVTAGAGPSRRPRRSGRSGPRAGPGGRGPGPRRGRSPGGSGDRSDRDRTGRSRRPGHAGHSERRGPARSSAQPPARPAGLGEVDVVEPAGGCQADLVVRGVGRDAGRLGDPPVEAGGPLPAHDPVGLGAMGDQLTEAPAPARGLGGHGATRRHSEPPDAELGEAARRRRPGRLAALGVGDRYDPVRAGRQGRTAAITWPGTQHLPCSFTRGAPRPSPVHAGRPSTYLDSASPQIGPLSRRNVGPRGFLVRRVSGKVLVPADGRRRRTRRKVGTGSHDPSLFPPADDRRPDGRDSRPGRSRHRPGHRPASLRRPLPLRRPADHAGAPGGQPQGRPQRLHPPRGPALARGRARRGGPMTATVRRLQPVADWSAKLDLHRTGFAFALEADERSPLTIRQYLRGVDAFLEVLGEAGADLDPMSWDRATADLFKVALKRRGLAANTRRIRWVGVLRWLSYLVEVRELTDNPWRGLKPPELQDRPAVPVVSDETFTALLQTTSGRTFTALRDTAIMWLLRDTGLRRSELCNILLAPQAPARATEPDGDLDLVNRRLVVHRKGGRIGPAKFGATTARALLAYLAARADHPEAATVETRQAHTHRWAGRPLFLASTQGPLQGGLTPGGLHSMLKRRCAQAGVPAVHPHQFRHTFFDAVLEDGMEMNDVVELGGLTSPAVLYRTYAKARAQERALAHYKSPSDRWARDRRAGRTRR